MTTKVSSNLVALDGPIDATDDLGASAARYKDLYLSGGAYLGGIGAANKLDDYEEGTWTPTFNWAGETTPPTMNQVLNAKYTKIGNRVCITIYASFSALGVGNSGLNVGGLPFAVATSYTCTSIWATNCNPLGFFAAAAATSVRIAQLVGNSGNLANTDLLTSTELGFTFVYETNG